MVICRWSRLADGCEADVLDVLTAQCTKCGREHLFCKQCRPMDEWGGCDCRTGITVGEFRHLLNEIIDEGELPLDSLLEVLVWDFESEDEAVHPVRGLIFDVDDNKLILDTTGDEEG